MILTVIKRDGRKVGFHTDKIIAAIQKAMLATDLGEDISLAQQIAQRIASSP